MPDTFQLFRKGIKKDVRQNRLGFFFFFKEQILGSITTNKASGSDRIPVELFQILKDDAVKVRHSSASKFGKLSSGNRIGKGQISFQSQRKAMPKNVQTTTRLY